MTELLDGYIDILRKLSVRRQAEVDAPTYGLYAEDLARERIDLADLDIVCYQIGRTPRREFESAFPALGDLLEACRHVREARRARELEAAAANAPKQILGEPMTRERAKAWLAKIKAAAHGKALS